MNIIKKIQIWHKQNRCLHKNFKNIDSITLFIDDEKRLPERIIHIRKCLDCELLYKQNSIYSYRTKNTYSIVPSKQIRRLNKKERKNLEVEGGILYDNKTISVSEINRKNV